MSTKRRSVELAATVNIHGATLDTDWGPDVPLLPADCMTSIPFSAAWKEPIAIGSALNSDEEVSPIEIVIRSTPSAIASSKAAKSAAEVHPSVLQTLYAAILAEGTPPLAVPLASPKKLALFMLFPAAVDAV